MMTTLVCPGWRIYLFFYYRKGGLRYEYGLEVSVGFGVWSLRLCHISPDSDFFAQSMMFSRYFGVFSGLIWLLSCFGDVVVRSVHYSSVVLP